MQTVDVELAKGAEPDRLAQSLEFDDEVGMVIAEMFASRNRRMPEINMRQAMVPNFAQEHAAARYRA